MFGPIIPLSALRRQVDALKRKLDRVLAAYNLKSAAHRIVQRWNTAAEKPAHSSDTGKDTRKKKNPDPDPVDCVHIMAEAGFRPQSWNPLHAYIDQCQRYRAVPDAQEILNTLNLPRKLAKLIAILPTPNPTR